MNSVQQLIAFADIGKDGVSWYNDVRDCIFTKCRRHGWDMDKFIDVFAITSPRVGVVRNWQATIEYFETGSLPRGFIKSTHTALQHYEETSEIRGPKTSAFARALHGDTTVLVLDVWMARALGVPETAVTRKYNMVEALARVKQVAKRMDWTVRDTQAAIWWGVCLTHGVRPGNLQTAAQSTSQLSFEF